jgi:hypothetical protein
LAGLLSHFSITFVETLSKFVEKKLFGWKVTLCENVSNYLFFSANLLDQLEKVQYFDHAWFLLIFKAILTVKQEKFSFQFLTVKYQGLYCGWW